MIAPVKITCKRCGERKELTTDNFAFMRFERSYTKNGVTYRKKIERWFHTCKRCMGAQVGEARMAYNSARAALPKPETMRCVACGHEKPYTKEFFPPRPPTGTLFKRCRECFALWAKWYRRTRKGRKSRELWVRSKSGMASIRRASKSGAALVRRKRYYEKIVTSDRKARNALSEAIERGEVVRPERCHDCERRRCTSRKLRAWFNSGRKNYLDVTFVCYRCYSRRRSAKKQVAGPTSWKSLGELTREERQKMIDDACAALRAAGLYHLAH